MALGHFADGRVSAVFGTHGHVPTADAQILVNGTAYMTDAGMCGDYDSIIGMDKAEPLQRFTSKIPSSRCTPAMGPASICGVFIEIDDATGLALFIFALVLFFLLDSVLIGAGYLISRATPASRGAQKPA